MGSPPRKILRLKIDINNKPRKIWMKKSDLKCLTSFTCLKAYTTNSWYFDSGRCSRHMTGDRSLLVNYKRVFGGLVTFGDGIKRRVLGKETLNIRGFPKIKNMLHVDGFKTNLIIISQLCELSLYVKFTYDKCLVLNEFEECVFEGSRSLDNCYTFSPPHT